MENGRFLIRHKENLSAPIAFNDKGLQSIANIFKIGEPNTPPTPVTYHH